ncbi:MAG: peptidoglycan-binding protein, partial [Paracoccaceae bacterium]
MALSRRTGQRFQGSIWPGFVDAMTGLLLVLMFVLTIFMVIQFVLRETISGQETELNTLSAEIAAIAEALGLEQERVKSLETELGTLSSNLTDAETQVAAQSALIAQLTAERDQTANALADANSKITAFEAQVAGLLAAQQENLANIQSL